MSTCRRRDWTGWRSSRSRRREGSRSAEGTSPPRPARRRSSTAPRRTQARTPDRCWRTPARGDAGARPERDRRHGRRTGAQGQAPGELQPTGSDVLFPGRQLEKKRGAALGTVLSPELTTELGDDAVGDREAEPASLAGGLGREERVEDPRHQFRRDPRPGVAHFQADARAVRPAAHRQHTRPGTLHHRLVRVLHEVQEHLLELVLVPRACSTSEHGRRSGGDCRAKSRRFWMMRAARVASSVTILRRSRTCSVAWGFASRSCVWPRIVVRGLLISCATPEASLPTADSFSAWMSCVWVRLSSSSWRRVSESRRALSSASPIWSAVASRSATSLPSKRSRILRPSESVPRILPRLLIGTQTKPRMRSRRTAARAAGSRSG